MNRDRKKEKMICFYVHICFRTFQKLHVSIFCCCFSCCCCHKLQHTHTQLFLFFFFFKRYIVCRQLGLKFVELRNSFLFSFMCLVLLFFVQLLFIALATAKRQLNWNSINILIQTRHYSYIGIIYICNTY